MFPTIILIALAVSALAAVVGIMVLRNKSKSNEDIMAGVRERAEQRRQDRAFMNTTPVEDPYDRTYNLAAAMSAVEVDESANGYGQLDDEQKRVIAAIFDNQAQTASSLSLTSTHGARWNHSVFGDLNTVKPIRDKDIWSNSRN